MDSTNTEINDLRVQLEAYRTKMSLLQQEVSLIFDKSDKIELLRARELEEVSKARDRLDIKLQKYKTYVKQLERERDDLRDSVTEFVEKVESNPGALNLWPRSHMEMKSFLDPISGLDKNKVLVDTPELLSYAIARITSLTQQRDLERQNFKQMQHLFEAQVRTLQAQVARRDATIAACQEHASHHAADPLPNQNAGIKATPTILPLSDEQIIKALRRTMENNHALETEVRMLGQKLERVKLSSEHPAPTDPAISSVHHELEAVPDRDDLGSYVAPQHKPIVPAEPESPEPKPYRITRPSDPSNRHPAPLSNADVLNRPHLPQIGALDHEINYLLSKIDAFKEERNLLKEFLASQQLASSQDFTSDITPQPTTTSKDIPPGPSQHTPPQEHNELQAPWISAPAQEQNSQRITVEIWPPSDADPHHAGAEWAETANNGANDQLPETHGVFDGDGEVSMELATPLTPSNIILPDGGASRSSRTQSPVSSSEGSPRMIRPRILPSPLPPASILNSLRQRPQSAPPLVATAAMIAEAESDHEQLEQELSEVQRKLEEREQEVAELRAMLQAIHNHEEK